MENYQPEKNEQTLEILTREEILTLAPEKLAEYLNQLEKENQLEQYLQEAIHDDAIVAQLSYWEKWYTPDQQKLIDQLVQERFDKESPNWELPLGLEKRFTDEELRLIFSNTLHIQLTFGCSRGCDRCCLDAVPGVRSYIPANQLENLLKRFGQEFARIKPPLYYASEPKDYVDQKSGHQYQDIHKMVEENAGYSPFIATANFTGQDWQEFLNQNPDNARLSLFDREDHEEIKERIKARSYGENDKHEPGFGISRKNEGVHPEEKGVYSTPARWRSGVVLTPRGLYNFAPILTSDHFPQGQIISPIEDIMADPESEKNLAQDFLRHCVVKNKWHIDRANEDFQKFLVTKRYKDGGKYPPYIYMLETLSGSFLTWTDLDGEIKETEKFNPKNLRHLIWASIISSNYFIGRDEELSDQDLHDLKFFILNQENLPPTKDTEEFTGWRIEVPESGQYKIVLIKKPDDRGVFGILVSKNTEK